jgi:hypothetical protein
VVINREYLRSLRETLASLERLEPDPITWAMLTAAAEAAEQQSRWRAEIRAQEFRE